MATNIGDGTMPAGTFGELALMIAQDPALKEKFISDPAGTLARIPAKPLENDVWIYRMVVASLGLAILGSVVGSIVLASDRKESPAGLVAIGSAAVGALGGLLAPSPVARRS